MRYTFEIWVKTAKQDYPVKEEYVTVEAVSYEEARTLVNQRTYEDYGWNCQRWISLRESIIPDQLDLPFEHTSAGNIRRLNEAYQD